MEKEESTISMNETASSAASASGKYIPPAFTPPTKDTIGKVCLIFLCYYYCYV